MIQELRLGNFILVQETAKRWKVMEVDFDLFARVYADGVQAEGIELTSTLLQKCGFVENEGGYHIILDNDTLSKLDWDGPTGLYIVEDGHEFDVSKNQYLHQLQNLYFALTGKELEVNL